jgi:adenylate cyclase
MLFADVRGSTNLAMKMSARSFRNLINRFYVVENDVLIKHDAMVDRLIGDKVVDLFIPGLAGEKHSRKATYAARKILQETELGLDLGATSFPLRKNFFSPKCSADQIKNDHIENYDHS